jgi:hypothetical protein
MKANFQRRHYEAIADVLKGLEPTTQVGRGDSPLQKYGEKRMLDLVTERLEVMFKADNGKFKAERFRKATNNLV